jgi:hypothetical protein
LLLIFFGAFSGHKRVEKYIKGHGNPVQVEQLTWNCEVEEYLPAFAEEGLTQPFTQADSDY